MEEVLVGKPLWSLALPKLSINEIKAIIAYIVLPKYSINEIYAMMMMMTVPNSLVSQKDPGGSRGGGGRGGRLKKKRTDRNSEARRGRFNRSNSVRGVGCKEQEKTWMVV